MSILSVTLLLHWSKHTKFQKCKLSAYRGKEVNTSNSGQFKWELWPPGDPYPNQMRNPWLSLSQLSQDSQICHFLRTV